MYHLSKNFLKKAKMPKLNHGIGAKCTVFTKFIHPTSLINTKYPTFDRNHRFTVVLIGEKERTINKKAKPCYTFRNDDFENAILYAVKRNIVVIEEDSPDHFFDKQHGGSQGPVTVERSDDEETPLQQLGSRFDEDINDIHAAGAIIDDDNEPAEENVPEKSPDNQDKEKTVFEESWGFKGICYRKKDMHMNRGASIRILSELWSGLSAVDWFMLFFQLSL